jgi:hypothetical protein
MKQESYVVYWIDKKGENRKSSTLAISEENAIWITEYVHKDLVKSIKAEKGTIPFPSF